MKHRKPVKLSKGGRGCDPDPLYGCLIGREHDTGVTILFYGTDNVGEGPALHVHPYDEIFIIREGRARYVIGDQEFEAEAGDILIGPRNIPHKFENVGPGRLDTCDIHLSDEWIQTDLFDPEKGKREGNRQD